MSAGTLLLTLSLAVTPLQWSPEPTGVTDGILYRIEGTSPDSLWSVGIDITRDGEALLFSPMALRRESGRWVETKQPHAHGRLSDLVVRGANDVWAVGNTDDVGGFPIVQHWNGTEWTLVDAPPLRPGWFGEYTSISEAPNGDLWITGGMQTLEGTESEDLIYRYANGVWHRISTEGWDDTLSYVWNTVPVSPTDVWAVAIGGIAHFDGQTWTRAKLPGYTGPRKMNIQDLVVRGPNDIWAVGHKPDDELWRRPYVVHYDGTAWTELATPADTAVLDSIQFVDGNMLVFGENPNSGEPYVLAQKGNSFVRIAAPPRAGALLDSVQLDGRIWTVGAASPHGDDVQDPYVAVSKKAFTTLPE